MGIFRRLAWFFKQEWKAYLMGTSILLTVAILAAIIPMIVAQIIDKMTNNTLSWQQLLLYISAIVVITVLQYGMRYFWRTAIFGTAAKLEKIMRSRLFNHFTKMDAVFFQSHRTGDLMAHATNDLGAIRRVAGGGILTLVDSLSQGLTTLFMMFVAVDWRLSLAAVMPLPLLAIGIRLNGRAVQKPFRTAQAAFSSLNDKVQESVTGVKVIKTFGEEARDIEDFKMQTADVVKKNVHVYSLDAFFRPMIQTVSGMTTMIGLFYGGYLVVKGEITVGLLVAFLNYIVRMTWPMVAVGELINILERGTASYDRVELLLKENSSIVQHPKGVSQSIAGDIEFDIEYFKYPNSTLETLNDIKFTLKQGQTLGVVGKTGSGKTTLFKMLLREYDDFEGDIVYNGVPIKRYNLNSLLSQIGYVPQDNFLFSTTIRDNIRFAAIDKPQAEIEEVAELTSVHHDILEFPEGYDTLVGERGVTLSGGQKQRIAIARALLINPELLILDDSLSAVDAKTEEKILTGLKEKRSNKSTIIAAHRLSSIMHAEEIIVLDQGKIIERGTHEQLLALNGWYKETYDKQQLENALLEGGQE